MGRCLNDKLVPAHPQTQARQYGCADAQKDTDSDGVDDAADLFPNTAPGAVVDSNGCSEAQQNNTASPVPTLPVWMIMLLISMLAGLGVRRGKSNLLVE